LWSAEGLNPKRMASSGSLAIQTNFVFILLEHEKVERIKRRKVHYSHYRNVTGAPARPGRTFNSKNKSLGMAHNKYTFTRMVPKGNHATTSISTETMPKD
ncbi:hypothetical protein NPIL_641601, partial [Nephila pilipes]